MWTFEQWKALNNKLQSDNLFYQEFIAQGAAILRAHEQNVQAVVKGSAMGCCISVVADKPGLSNPWLPGKEQRSNDADYEVRGLAANCPPHLASDVGHELANQSGTFGLLWFVDKDNVCKCSLRSNGDYDVSAIAKVFGGGGHRNAAGFQIDIQTLLGWLK